MAAGAGALLIAAAIGYMIVYGLRHPTQSPPQVTVEAVSMTPNAGGYLVQFRARNEGSSTAAAVLVGGELKQNGATVEASEVTLDYVPQHSEREGGLLFTRDPSRHELQLRVKGYEKP